MNRLDAIRARLEAEDKWAASKVANVIWLTWWLNEHDQQREPTVDLELDC